METAYSRVLDESTIAMVELWLRGNVEASKTYSDDGTYAWKHKAECRGSYDEYDMHGKRYKVLGIDKYVHCLEFEEAARRCGFDMGPEQAPQGGRKIKITFKKDAPCLVERKPS
jgi:hypothetical protein